MTLCVCVLVHASMWISEENILNVLAGSGLCVLPNIVIPTSDDMAMLPVLSLYYSVSKIIFITCV